MDTFASFANCHEGNRTSVVSSSLFGYEVIPSVPDIVIVTPTKPPLIIGGNKKVCEIMIKTGDDISIVDGRLDLSVDGKLKLGTRSLSVRKVGPNSSSRLEFPVDMRRTTVADFHKVELLFNVTFCKGDVDEEERVITEREHMTAQLRHVITLRSCLGFEGLKTEFKDFMQRDVLAQVVLRSLLPETSIVRSVEAFGVSKTKLNHLVNEGEELFLSFQLPEDFGSEVDDDGNGNGNGNGNDTMLLRIEYETLFDGNVFKQSIELEKNVLAMVSDLRRSQKAIVSARQNKNNFLRIEDGNGGVKNMTLHFGGGGDEFQIKGGKGWILLGKTKGKLEKGQSVLYIEGIPNNPDTAGSALSVSGIEFFIDGEKTLLNNYKDLQ